MNKDSLKEKKEKVKKEKLLYFRVIQVRKNNWRTSLDVCTECTNHAY